MCVQTRLAKYYIPLEESDKHGLEHDVHRLIATRCGRLPCHCAHTRQAEQGLQRRDPKHTNFVEVRLSLLPAELCCARR